MSMVCFLPCRAGSERVPNKNVRPFCGHALGLLEIKLQQLETARSIDHVVLSTNDPAVLDYAATNAGSKVECVRRVEHLASSSTSTDDLVGHVLEVTKDDHILWTHVTSPFVTATVYEDMIAAYYRSLETGYDSLMTVTEIRSFVWYQGRPVNYDRSVERWPRTQTLEPVQEVNSAGFIHTRAGYERHRDRIGVNPRLFPLDHMVGFDIDWIEDFRLAEAFLNEGLVTLS